MKPVRALLGFVYDLVVGDSWPLTAVIAALLAAAAIAASVAIVAPVTLALGTAIAAAVAGPVTVFLEARASVRRTEG